MELRVSQLNNGMMWSMNPAYAGRWACLVVLKRRMESI